MEIVWLDSPTTAQRGSTLAFWQLLQMWGKGKETEVRLERCQQYIYILTAESSVKVQYLELYILGKSY